MLQGRGTKRVFVYADGHLEPSCRSFHEDAEPMGAAKKLKKAKWAKSAAGTCSRSSIRASKQIKKFNKDSKLCERLQEITALYI